MELGEWDPRWVVLVAFLVEALVGELMVALGRRRGTVTGRRDPLLATARLFLKAQFVLATLAILSVVLIAEGVPPAVPEDPSALLPEQVARWLRDEHAAVDHLRDVLGAALLYLALQLWSAFSFTGRVLLGRPSIAAAVPKT